MNQWWYLHPKTALFSIIAYVFVSCLHVVEAQSPAQKARGYPGGQRGNIYSDDIEAVRREQKDGVVNGYERSREGRRPTVDQARLHKDVEAQITQLKLDRQIKEYTDRVAQQEVRVRNQKRILDEAMTPLQSFSSSQRSGYDPVPFRKRMYEQELSEWNTSHNPLCEDFLTYRECACVQGSEGKRRKQAAVERALEAYKDALKEKTKKDAAATKEAADKEKKRMETIASEQAEYDRMLNALKEDTARLADLNRQRASAAGPAQASVPAGAASGTASVDAKSQSAIGGQSIQGPPRAQTRPSYRIEFDEDAPKRTINP